MLRTTDRKDIAILCLVTSFVFFLASGAMALLIRAELARPGLQFLSNEQYNQLFTMHGTIMLLLYAAPQRLLVLAVPVRRADRALRLLNAGRGRRLRLDRLHAPVRRGPLTRQRVRPVDHRLVVGGLGTILGAVNFVTTIVCMRAPGMRCSGTD
jgi:cytochrome c oxidase subunit 1